VSGLGGAGGGAPVGVLFAIADLVSLVPASADHSPHITRIHPIYATESADGKTSCTYTATYYCCLDLGATTVEPAKAGAASTTAAPAAKAAPAAVTAETEEDIAPATQEVVAAPAAKTAAKAAAKAAAAPSPAPKQVAVGTGMARAGGGLMNAATGGLMGSMLGGGGGGGGGGGNAITQGAGLATGMIPGAGAIPFVGRRRRAMA